jgi:hypothetical protein
VCADSTSLISNRGRYLTKLVETRSWWQGGHSRDQCIQLSSLLASFASAAAGASWDVGRVVSRHESITPQRFDRRERVKAKYVANRLFI